MKIVLFYTAIISLLFLSCAKTGTISGGPKDIDPPVLLEAEPPLESTDIAPEKISLTFNEFLDIKDLRTDLIVSPPLNNNPVAELKGKKLVLEISDTLNENTTYSLNFGNGLKDYNEGNPIPNFSYVFSTGSYIDSMAVTGRVLDAYTRQPADPKETGVSILMYRNLSDTAFTDERALYVSICDEEGYFTVKNIKEGTYNIYALTDENTSYNYDGDKEQIAFIDSAFTLNASMFDSIATDIDFISAHESDTAANDTLYEEEILYALHLNLFLFKEERYKQKLSKKERKEAYKIDLIFDEPQHHLNYSLLNDSLKTDWYIEERNAGLDTFAIWVTDSTLYNNDSIWLLTDYLTGEKDSLYTHTDTLLMKHYKRKSKGSSSSSTKGRGGKGAKAGKPGQNTSGKSEFIFDTWPKKGKKIHLDQPSITFVFEKPLLSYDTSKIYLIKTVDTLQFNVPLTFNKTDSLPRNLNSTFEIEPGLAYQLKMLPGAFVNVYNEQLQDTLNYTYQSQKEDFYGILNFNITGISEHVLIQMYKGKAETVVKETALDEDQIWRIEYLPPGDYNFRLIYDSNQNGKWDTGSYDDKRQPEKVKYYHQNINIRSNWEIEENWDINSIFIPEPETVEGEQLEM